MRQVSYLLLQFHLRGMCRMDTGLDSFMDGSQPLSLIGGMLVFPSALFIWKSNNEIANIPVFLSFSILDVGGY